MNVPGQPHNCSSEGFDSSPDVSVVRMRSPCGVLLKMKIATGLSGKRRMGRYNRRALIGQ